ncbi:MULTISPECIES: hypothetical protein [Burkholderia]|uniref:hypothetical protein n=1 Tax=Burkholderia TaxID=32008 RepID=UPI000F5946F8|nr:MULTISPECIES: hypothetical protein [Burkholderia]
MNYNEEEVMGLVRRFPPDFMFDGVVFKFFGRALDDFKEFSKGRWPLGNYTVSVNSESDGRMVAISFSPITVDLVDDIPFEIADRGVYKNGMGVTYVYSTGDGKLLKKIYMR